jgi:hypothetical protein
MTLALSRPESAPHHVLSRVPDNPLEHGLGLSSQSGKPGSNLRYELSARPDEQRALATAGTYSKASRHCQVPLDKRASIRSPNIRMDW